MALATISIEIDQFGLTCAVIAGSYFVLWSNYLSPPHRFSAWPIEMHLFLLLPSCKQETGKSLILEQMLQSVPYPVTPKAMQDEPRSPRRNRVGNSNKATSEIAPKIQEDGAKKWKRAG
ncbi:uncharacterized protein LOC126699623 isoform X3 [Quercus robur]|uniref:uncharacterized protein LOC126699623 isoform X3 n=1 Tax=Quercus robur TaxID=38942 RepID=UPI002163DD48|nr:uncharacterized protein LOC126699623 isoform X3 [Quercus robur]